MPQWSADIELDEAAVRSLIHAYFPALLAPGGALTNIGEGWDNTVWAVGEVAFRIPRRTVALPLLEQEVEFLPRIAELVPLPVPRPIHVDPPRPERGWPLVGAALLDGAEFATASVGDAQLDVFATAVGGFLRVLHAPGTRAHVDPSGRLAIDRNGRGDMARVVPATRGAVADLAQGLLAPQQLDAASHILDTTVDVVNDEEAVLLHGDLHIRHVLVDGSGTPTGIIDWGDLCAGPRSIDLMLYWSALTPDAREHFLRAYGAVSPAALACARPLAMYSCAVLATYAQHEGMDQLAQASLTALRRTLAS